MKGNGKAAQEAAARKEFETGAATRTGRLELRRRAMEARRELVRSGGIPQAWIDEQAAVHENSGDEARKALRAVRERRELAMRIDLSVWADSAREELDAMRVVLERREQGARRPTAKQYFEYEVLDIRFPHVDAQWQYQRTNFGQREIVAIQRLGLALAYVRGDELPADALERVQSRMVEAAIDVGCEHPEAELLARQHYLFEEPLQDVQTKPGLKRLEANAISRLKERLDAEGGERERRMLQGWVNPGVGIGFDCTVFGVFRQERGDRGVGYATTGFGRLFRRGSPGSDASPAGDAAAGACAVGHAQPVPGNGARRRDRRGGACDDWPHEGADALRPGGGVARCAGEGPCRGRGPGRGHARAGRSC